MYAIIETGGKQYKVQPGQVLDVELVEAEGDKVKFDRVLLAGDEKKVSIGTPVIKNAFVMASVVEAIVKGEKKLAFKKAKRKDWQWRRGHRQKSTRVRIDEITVG